jgi:uncharacterized protein (TIGR03663 family)
MIGKLTIRRFIEKRHIYIFILIVIIAVILRFYNLPLRVMHHDEACGHFIFSNAICSQEKYTYDPTYHGPFLYHAVCASFKIFGINDYSLRLMPAIFGVILLFLFYLIRKEIGSIGYLASSLFIAISPSCVYYSRFLLHDMFFLVFMAYSLYFFCIYFRSKKTKHIFFAFVFWALMFTVKENAYIVLAVSLSYTGIYYFYIHFKNNTGLREFLLNPIKKAIKNWRIILVCIVLFLFVFSLFFSSGFRYLDNIKLGFTLPVAVWLDKSITWVGHFKPYTFYLEIITNFELPIVVFGFLGIISSLRRKKNKWYFLIYFSLLNALIYFILPYKTPWLILHILFPFAIFAGIYIQRIFDEFINKPLIFTLLILLVLSLIYAQTLNISYKANFIDYDNPSNLLVYVQHTRNISVFVNEFKEYAKSLNHSISAIYIADDFWPEKYYLRDYRLDFYTGILKSNTPPLCIGNQNKDCVNIAWYDVIVINDMEEELLGTYINLKNYHILRFYQRDGIYVRAYFKD